MTKEKVDTVFRNIEELLTNKDEHPNDEELIAVCISKNFGLWNPGNVIRDSTIKNCSSCGMEILASPKVNSAAENTPKLKLICFGCAKEKIKKESLK